MKLNWCKISNRNKSMNKGMQLMISGKKLMLRSKKFHGWFTLLKGTMSPQFYISPVRTDCLERWFWSCTHSQWIWILHYLNCHEHRIRCCLKVMVFVPSFSSNNLVLSYCVALTCGQSAVQIIGVWIQWLT